VSEHGVQNFKMVERTTKLRQPCSTQYFRKGCGRSTSDKTDLKNRRIKIVVLTTVKEKSIRIGDTIVHEKLGVTVLFLRYSLVMFHRKCTEHCSCSTGFQQIFLYLITGTMLSEGRGQN
jgi:hypothetical protein